MRVLEGVTLAPLTTLRVGGGARRFVEVEQEREIVEAVLEADARREAVFVLGAGSNVLVGDAGFDGLVVRVASRGVEVARDGARVRLEVAAGEPWDALVERAVGEGWSGVEALSGIPGLAGATPIQNVGAYGQDVSETIRRVRVLDREARAVRDLDAAACGFSYRASAFKGGDRFVVLGVTFELEVRPESAAVRYAELARALSIAPGSRAPLGEVRSTVLSLRRGKGMVLDPDDPESVSAGSFFVNPILDGPTLVALEGRLVSRGLDPAALPRFPEPEARTASPSEAPRGQNLTKVPAAWLIERGGFAKGWAPSALARAGISRKHALALVNRGGATAQEILEAARAIQRGVEEAFGVRLAPEPVLVGCRL